MKQCSLFLLFTFYFLIGNAQLPSYLPTNGLVGWWPFNGNANDESGNGNNGTVNGATLIPDRLGQNASAYNFNGNRNYIQIPDLASIRNSSQFSLSYWIHLSTDNPGGMVFNQWLTGYGGSNENLGLQLSTSSGIGVCFLGGCPGGVGSDTNLISKNQWKHVVFLFDGTKNANERCSIYINGVWKGNYGNSLVPSVIGSSYPSKTVFGASSGPNWSWLTDNVYNFFIGSLDDIAIYNRALTQQEITALYTATPPCTATVSTTNLSISSASLPYIWNGLTFNTAGTQTAHLTNACGADSAATLNLTVTNTLPSYLPANGLVGWWPFNGNANDESGNGNHGTVNGATLTSDRFGNSGRAYQFNQNYILIPNSSVYNSTNLTASFWIKTNNSGRQIAFVRNKYANASNESFGFSFSDVTNKGVLFAAKYNTPNCIAGQGWVRNEKVIDVANDQFHHIVGVVSGSNTYLYVDGILEQTFTTSYAQMSECWGGDFQVGRNWSADPAFFIGSIDDIAIYNRALSQQEITALYNGTNGNTPANTDSTSVSARFPTGISYQAVARDSIGQVLANTNLTVRFTLRDSGINGNIVYAETNAVTTNRLGLFTAVIGNGNAQTNTYSSINWMGQQKFLQVEIDKGNGYQLIGVQQLLSVPYSNASQTATKIKNPNLPVYTNNAAAVQGGLQPGDMYRTVQGVLMVVY